jgi:hypothetical protein
MYREHGMHRVGESAGGDGGISLERVGPRVLRKPVRLCVSIMATPLRSQRHGNCSRGVAAPRSCGTRYQLPARRGLCGDRAGLRASVEAVGSIGMGISMAVNDHDVDCAREA